MAFTKIHNRLARWQGVKATRCGALVAVLSYFALINPAAAEVLRNQVAVFAALDKVTARISRLEIELNGTVQFGALKVTPRVCHSRPPTEPPKTTSFVEVEEIELDGSVRRLFAGWMFAESPGLNAVEHPVFDVWLTECKALREGQMASQTDETLNQASSPHTNSQTPRKRRSLR